jgi:hypothetical protein
MSLLACLVLGAMAMGLAACGGDDDSGSSGGDDDDDSSSSSSGGSGSDVDKRYVAAVCKAQLKLQDSLLNAEEDNADASEEEAVEILIPFMQTYVNDLKKAKPPSDAKEFHDDVVKAFSDGIAKLKKEKSIDVLQDIDPGSPPRRVAERLDKVAEDNEDCQEAEFTFSE